MSDQKSPEAAMANFIAETVDYWDGYLDHIDDDMPDGAWFQMHVESFEYNQQNWDEITEGMDFPPWPEGEIDGHDMMMAYLEYKHGESCAADYN